MTLDESPLGKAVAYASTHDPALLFPVARAPQRAELGLDGALPFTGCDVWNAYELGWLDLRGKPRVALAEIRVPADSPALIESKSLKLYLNGLSQTRLASAEDVRQLLQRDLSEAAGANVGVVLAMATANGAFAIEPLPGECIDDLPVDISSYGPPDPALLVADPDLRASETLLSHLLKSNCPVTGQPDWGSVQIRYSGPRIDRAGLLRYLVSYREHCGFHEQCVERIFLDVARQCAPARLSVLARYTRRGGLDINPFRTNVPGESVGNPRTLRQ